MSNTFFACDGHCAHAKHPNSSKIYLMLIKLIVIHCNLNLHQNNIGIGPETKLFEHGLTCSRSSGIFKRPSPKWNMHPQLQHGLALVDTGISLSDMGLTRPENRLIRLLNIPDRFFSGRPDGGDPFRSSVLPRDRLACRVGWQPLGTYSSARRPDRRINPGRRRCPPLPLMFSGIL